jgi:hypothetical protein
MSRPTPNVFQLNEATSAGRIEGSERLHLIRNTVVERKPLLFLEPSGCQTAHRARRPRIFTIDIAQSFTPHALAYYPRLASAKEGDYAE